MKKLSLFQYFCIVGFILAIIVAFANLSVLLFGVPIDYDGSILKFIMSVMFSLVYIAFFIITGKRESIK